MDISKVYEDQRARAMASFSDIVSEARVLRLDSGEPLKLRLEIINGSIVDIFYLSQTLSSWLRRCLRGELYCERSQVRLCRLSLREAKRLRGEAEANPEPVPHQIPRCARNRLRNPSVRGDCFTSFAMTGAQRLNL